MVSVCALFHHDSVALYVSATVYCHFWVRIAFCFGLVFQCVYICKFSYLKIMEAGFTVFSIGALYRLYFFLFINNSFVNL